MLSNDVGAVHPVAVTSRSASTTLPSPSSTLRNAFRPLARVTVSPRRTSTKAAISTPAASRSAAASSPFPLADRTTTLAPGRTA